MQTNVQIDSKNLRASPDPTSVQVYDPRTKTLKVGGCWDYIVIISTENMQSMTIELFFACFFSQCRWYLSVYSVK
jgi:hypothetical protein